MSEEVGDLTPAERRVHINISILKASSLDPSGLYFGLWNMPGTKFCSSSTLTKSEMVAWKQF